MENVELRNGNATVIQCERKLCSPFEIIWELFPYSTKSVNTLKGFPSFGNNWDLFLTENIFFCSKSTQDARVILVCFKISFKNVVSR